MLSVVNPHFPDGTPCSSFFAKGSFRNNFDLNFFYFEKRAINKIISDKNPKYVICNVLILYHYNSHVL